LRRGKEFRECDFRFFGRSIRFEKGLGRAGETPGVRREKGKVFKFSFGRLKKLLNFAPR